MATQQPQIIQEPVWLVGLRFDPDSEDPTYYCLLLGEEQEPLVAEGSLLLFASPRLIPQALEAAGIGLGVDPSVFATADARADYSLALYVLTSEEKDEQAVIIDALNLLFDLVKATRGTFPVAYRKQLFDFADHMTFSKSHSAFIQNQPQVRTQLVDGILWGIGWVMTHAHVIHSPP